MSFLSRTSVALTVGLVFSSVGVAKEAVVSPFLPRSVDRLVALNITSLVSSELDFNPDYELVTQLEDLPRGMNSSCINKASCLRPIGRAHNANHLIAGAVAPKGRADFELYLVLFDTDRGTFIRKKTFTISRSPDVMADSIANVVNVLLTGQEKEAPVDESAPIADGSFDDFGDEDDFAFEEEPISHRMNLPGNSQNSLDDFEEVDPLEVEAERRTAERRRAEEAEAQRRAEQAAERRRAEEAAERRRQEQAAERRRAEEAEARRRADERRRADQAAERRRAEEAAARRRQEQRSRPEPIEEFDEVDDFEFGAVSADDIDVDDIEFGSAVSLIEEEQDYDDLDDLGLDTRYEEDDRDSRRSYDTVDNLDDPSPTETSRRTSSRSERSSASSSRRTTSRVRAPFVAQENSLTVTARAGVSKFQSLTFLTYGAEVAVPIGPKASFTAGIDFQSTKRTPTQEQQIKFGLPPELWNTILPFNFGAIRRFGSGRFQPFVGGDLVLTPYTKDMKVAVGARARAGTDVMVSKTVGVNLGLSTGAWYGSRFDSIEEGLQDFGIVPQFTVGTSFLF